MRVAGLDKNGDWQFGRGRATYKIRSNAIAQNVITRLRSLTNDWFLDVQFGIDWYTLLGNRNTRIQILQAVESTVLGTFGVREITKLDLIDVDVNRFARIELSYIDIFNNETTEAVTIEAV